MPLDNAQFISELSITDPPGTDPVSEGDDQIRTTKRATQQSFPLIDAAVTLTAAQLNQAAIKNEANSFLGVCTFAQPSFGPAGAATAPSWSFTGSPTTGMYHSGNTLRFASAGTNSLAITASLANFFVPVRCNDGSVTNPSHSFNQETNLGMYRPANSLIGFAVAGADRMQIGDNIRAIDGTAGNPAWSFISQQNIGIYKTTDVLLFATQGVERLRLSASQARFAAPIYANSGSAAAPGYAFLSDVNMGMYRSASNVLNFATAGVDRIALTGSEINLKSTQVWAAPGSGLAPAYAFASNPGMGMFNSGGSFLSFATAGQARGSFSPTSELNIFQDGATGGVTINFMNSAGVVAWAIQYEGTAGFQPRQFSFSRFNSTTGAFIDIPLYIAVDGRVHTALPVLSP